MAWLVLLAYSQLQLAHRIATDQRFPAQPAWWPSGTAFTPAHMREGFLELRVWLGTPHRRNAAAARRDGHEVRGPARPALSRAQEGRRKNVTAARPSQGPALVR